MKKNFQIVLASSSASRKKIFKNIGFNFITRKPKVDEEKHQRTFKKKKYNIKKITKTLAELKCKSIKKRKSELVIGCDTLIKINNKIIHKAKNIKEAKKRIKELSGKQHQLYSSVVVYFDNKPVWEKTVKTNVKIRRLSKKEINNYIQECGKTIIKSVGCYEIEKKGPNIIEYIKGDFFNVMGFPLFPFLVFLKKFNIKK